MAYTIGYARGNNDGDPNDELNVFQVVDDRNMEMLWGPSTYDRRHLLTMSGQTELPGTGGVTLSAVARYMSGTPFTIHDSNFDPNQNGLSPDPLPPGSYSGTGQNAITVDNAGGLRGAYGPDYFQLDMRLGYRYRGGGEQTIDIFGELFNLTNRVNFVNPSGDRRSGNFLVPTRLLAAGTRGSSRWAFGTASESPRLDGVDGQAGRGLRPRPAWTESRFPAESLCCVRAIRTPAGQCVAQSFDWEAEIVRENSNGQWAPASPTSGVGTTFSGRPRAGQIHSVRWDMLCGPALS